MLEATVASFKNEVRNEVDRLVFVDFWAPWCGPCKATAPIVERLSKEYTDVKFVKVNADDEESLLKEFGIMGIPTFLFFKNNEIIARHIGYASESKFRTLIEKYK